MATQDGLGKVVLPNHPVNGLQASRRCNQLVGRRVIGIIDHPSQGLSGGRRQGKFSLPVLLKNGQHDVQLDGTGRALTLDGVVPRLQGHGRLREPGHLNGPTPIDPPHITLDLPGQPSFLPGRQGSPRRGCGRTSFDRLLSMLWRRRRAMDGRSGCRSRQVIEESPAANQDH